MLKKALVPAAVATALAIALQPAAADSGPVQCSGTFSGTASDPVVSGAMFWSSSTPMTWWLGKTPS